ncbi:tetratricopeptide repeat protein [Desulfofustis glycolicus]|uniref:tetratricopeptide repeat protein n=1 Tax=Desulfofustis glycolicus TaxID=51195 RepID=UPI0009347038|nr:tetratricopeptide repeat protein [Desulfofustis glycolicus]
MTDEYNITLFIRVWFITTLFICGPIFVFTGFSDYLPLGAIASVIIAIIVFFIVSLLGNTLGNVLFGVGGKSGSGRPFAADLDKAKHYLQQKDMVRVKQIIDEVLSKDQACVEALMIKAQALIALGNNEQAKTVLRTILQIKTIDVQNRRWASALLDELSYR